MLAAIQLISQSPDHWMEVLQQWGDLLGGVVERFSGGEG